MDHKQHRKIRAQNMIKNLYPEQYRVSNVQVYGFFDYTDIIIPMYVEDHYLYNLINIFQQFNYPITYKVEGKNICYKLHYK